MARGPVLRRLRGEAAEGAAVCLLPACRSLSAADAGSVCHGDSIIGQEDPLYEAGCAGWGSASVCLFLGRPAPAASALCAVCLPHFGSPLHQLQMWHTAVLEES